MLRLGTQKEYMDSLFNVAGVHGTQYWVSDDGSASNDGLAPDRPLNLISSAVTLSEAGTTSNADRRDQIFVLGGVYNEAVVAMPKSCDLIGLGAYYAGYPVTLGSYWTIATGKVGTHIHGFYWTDTDTSNSILSIPTGSNWFHLSECFFYAGGTNDKCLEFGAGTTYYMIVEKNRFMGNIPYPYAIYINGNCHGGIIEKNLIFAQTAGIYIASGSGSGQLLIKENVIGRNQGDTGAQLAIGIDKKTEASMMIVGNWISAVDAIYGTGSGGNPNFSIGNSVVEALTADWETTPD